MNEKEAEKRIKEMNEERKSVYCPLADGACNTKCDCYAPPRMVEKAGHKGRYLVYEGFCTAYCLAGPG